MPIDYSRQIGKKITTKGYKKRVIHLEQIIYIKCEGCLATLFLHSEIKIHEIKTLRKYEEELYEMGFFRIRDNTIVNGNYITEIDTKKNKRTVKLGEIEFTVAKRRFKSFMDWVL